MATLSPSNTSSAPVGSSSRKKGFLDSSIGLKSVMAITGVLLILFVIGHLVGNLQVFAGPEKLNAYALFLQQLGPLLWAIRLGLLAIFVLHVVSAFKLRSINSQARPIPYAVKNNVKTSTASATMAETGMLILAFVVFHLAHFTLGYVQPEYYHLTDSKGRHDVYRMVVEGFRHGYYSIAYMIFMTILGLHLSHGIASVLQTLGFNHSRYSPQINRYAPLLAWVLAFGYITIPLGVLFGFVH